MIIVYHDNNKVHSIFDHQYQVDVPVENRRILKTFMHLACEYNDRILIWCQWNYKELLNIEEISNSFKTKNVMVSYGKEHYLPDTIGYVENSPFIKVNNLVKYPTWLMYSTVGAIYTTSLLKFKDLKFSNDFGYELNSIAKLGISKGLFCYSDPNLLLKSVVSQEEQTGFFRLFRFVKQHYKTRWVFLLLLNFLWHERKLTILPFLNSMFYRKRRFETSISLETSLLNLDTKLPTIDVIIPTVGRADYLHDVLKDLAQQTHLPTKVIIVEQNPQENSKTTLDFICSQLWPFKIKHQFIHQMGACNARNLALEQVDSDFLFLADDDIRFKSHVLKDALKIMSEYSLKATTLSCLQEGEQEIHQTPIQWITFGSGCSIIATKFAEKISFDTAFEFGFGEDSDFGMQLRNIGTDVIYLPHISILHLKAPIGGFRTIQEREWTKNSLQPKPSPTVMLYNLKHKSLYQLKGYKTLLFFKFYKKQTIRNPITYINQMNRRWEKSIYWAKQLMYKTD